MTIFTKLTALHDDVANIDYDLSTTTYQNLHDAVLANSGMSENKLKQFDSETLALLPTEDFEADENNKAELLQQATAFNRTYLDKFKRDLFSRVHKALYYMKLTRGRILKSGTVVEENGQFVSVTEYSKSTDEKYDTSRFKTNRAWGGTSPNPELNPVKALAEMDEEYTRLSTAFGLADKTCKSLNQERLDYAKARDLFINKYQTITEIQNFLNTICTEISYDEERQDLSSTLLRDKTSPLGETITKTKHVQYNIFLSREVKDFEYIRPYDYKAHYDEKVSFEPILSPITDNFADYKDDEVARHQLAIFEKVKSSNTEKITRYETPAEIEHRRQQRALIGAENYPFIVEINQGKLILLDGFNRLFGNDFPVSDKQIMVKVYHDLDEKQYSDVVYCVNDWKTKGKRFADLFYDRGVRGSLFVKYGLTVSVFPVLINTNVNDNLVAHVRDTNLLLTTGASDEGYPSERTFVANTFDAIRKKSDLTKEDTSKLIIDNKSKVFDTLRAIQKLVQQPTKDRVFDEMRDEILANEKSR